MLSSPAARSDLDCIFSNWKSSILPKSRARGGPAAEGERGRRKEMAREYEAWPAQRDRGMVKVQQALDLLPVRILGLNMGITGKIYTSTYIIYTRTHNTHTLCMRPRLDEKRSESSLFRTNICILYICYIHTQTHLYVRGCVRNVPSRLHFV